MSWFEFSQNNSGGSFVTDDQLCHRLFIEADSEAAAVAKATAMGVYFDGVHSGNDCPCCGDRWYSPEQCDFPMDYDKGTTFANVSKYAQYLADNYGWTEPDARLFYSDGRREQINGRKRAA